MDERDGRGKIIGHQLVINFSRTINHKFYNLTIHFMDSKGAKLI